MERGKNKMNAGENRRCESEMHRKKRMEERKWLKRGSIESRDVTFLLFLSLLLSTLPPSVSLSLIQHQLYVLVEEPFCGLSHYGVFYSVVRWSAGHRGRRQLERVCVGGARGCRGSGLDRHTPGLERLKLKFITPDNGKLFRKPLGSLWQTLQIGSFGRFISFNCLFILFY